jgi:CopG family nickel-responsive transcriptional regulator
MTDLTRFSVSLDRDLLKRFDDRVIEEGYPTRSKAVADLIRDALVRREWDQGKEVAGAVMMVFDHHRRDLVNRLVDIQHDFHGLVVSSQHIHLDHDNCLELVVVKGDPARIRELHRRLKGVKGVKLAQLATASTGEGL